MAAGRQPSVLIGSAQECGYRLTQLKHTRINIAAYCCANVIEDNGRDSDREPPTELSPVNYLPRRQKEIIKST
jgi:hypothetical protein